MVNIHDTVIQIDVNVIYRTFIFLIHIYRKYNSDACCS